MTAWWWQWGWTRSLPSEPWTRGGVQSSSVSSSATVRTADATSRAPGCPGSSSTRSERSVAVQLGSSPTTVCPARTYGSRIATVRRSFSLAAVSCPVEISVSPQQACSPVDCPITSTSHPAASSTVRASAGISGERASEKESTHSTT
ncbi:hypothetical protein ACFFX0_16085 [Citricoccus parietis]|uniref:Uncharacterized protein n=1 Tax=Citricoccus parietis TaxID=592307 RepID=A0ABV5G1V0_9MICC